MFLKNRNVALGILLIYFMFIINLLIDGYNRGILTIEDDFIFILFLIIPLGLGIWIGMTLKWTETK